MFEHFILTNGNIVYPAYMDNEKRMELKNFLGDNKELMYCSCRPDERLYYRLSSDLRFIPCHQNYVHNEKCVRSGDLKKRKSAYMHDEVEGVMVAYLKFNPANFSVPSNKEPEPSEDETSSSSLEESVNPLEEKEKEKKEKIEKEPLSPLATFIRYLNIDAYMERLISSGQVYSSDYFLSALYKRLSSVRISPMKKSIKELDYKVDGYKFFYAVLTGYRLDEKSTITIEYFGKKREYFVYPAILQKALIAFTKQYGMEPDFANDKVMIAGFMYERVSKKGNLYITPGRIHIFKVNEKGVYCDNSAFLNTTNSVYAYIEEHRLYKKCKVHYDLDNENKICELRCLGSDAYLGFNYANNKPANSLEKVVPLMEDDLLKRVLDEFLLD